MKFKKWNQLEMRALSADDDFDTLNASKDFGKLPLTDTFVWKINSNLDIEITD